jgi:hypothetical protein
MFATLALAIVFTFVYAAAARLRWAEKVLLLLLDILQSVPILGFLPDHRAVLAARLCRRWAGSHAGDVQAATRMLDEYQDVGRPSGGS